jgi:hypothetical protein
MTFSSGSDYSFSDNLMYMTKDPRAVTKIIIGSLVSLVPILSWAASGYTLRVIKNIRDRVDPSLPEWSGEFGKFFTEGLMVWLIQLIYSLPLLVIMMISGVPVLLAGAMSDSSSGNALGAMMAGGMCLVFLVAIVYVVAMVFWLQGALVNYAVKGELAAAFAFGEIMAIVKANSRMMIMTVVAVFVAGLIVSVAASILNLIPCLGQLVSVLLGMVAAFYTSLVVAYTCGHIARTV